jgi:V8-like Glu-specific endopeptidase
MIDVARPAQIVWLWIAVIYLTTTASLSHAEPVNPQARESVGYLLIIKANRSPNSTIVGSEATYVGTVFAASYTYETGVSKQFVVTARHAVVDESGNPSRSLFIQFPGKEPENVQLFTPDPSQWLFHKEADKVDLAVYPGLPDHVRVRRVQSDFWVTDELLEKEKISEGDEAFYTGLLPHFPGTPTSVNIGGLNVSGLVRELTPVTRFGRLALVDDNVLVDGRPLYFLDADNMPGHSGSPVFLWASPTRSSGGLTLASRIFGLYGVVSNVLEYGKDTRFVSSKSKPVDYRSVGVTGVVPVKYLREILESKSARKILGIN